MPEIDGEIVVEGLTSPQGLAFDSEGNLIVLDSGVGGDETIEIIDPTTFQPATGSVGETGRVLRLTSDGELEELITLPSLAVGGDFISAARVVELDGALYLTIGAWQAMMGEEVPIPFFGTVARLDDEGVTQVADLWAYEVENNPDETTNLESHPYGITVGPDGWLYVAEAAANALLRVNPADGAIETVAVFDPLPGVFPNRFRDGEPLADPVPTGVVVTEDGTAYVSLLSGAPFIPSSAKVLAVSPEGEVSDYAVGLTMLTDLTLGPDGNLYATQFSVFGIEGPVFNSGAVIRILTDGTSEVVVDGLPFVTAIAINEAGDGYVAINGAGIPQAGLIVLYAGLIDMEGMPMMDGMTEATPEATASP